jgi:predicted metal-dependent hydrolase
MSKKSGAIAELIEQFKGRDLDAHYFGYFECFNRRLYFEAHDVLEELWLADRTGPNYAFYKGLIQLAGAFVHLQKNRLRPSAALFKLADANLEKYPALHEQLRVDNVRELIRQWLQQLEAGNFEKNPLVPGVEPELRLES